FLYVEDVDAVVKQAVGAGATVAMEVADQFWGDRFGSVTDPFGHLWSIATHVEDVPPEEMAERAKEAMAAVASYPAVARLLPRYGSRRSRPRSSDRGRRPHEGGEESGQVLDHLPGNAACRPGADGAGVGGLRYLAPRGRGRGGRPGCADECGRP